MTKVCHMTSVHEAEDMRIFHKECTSLAKAGYDVYLIAPGESYEKNGVHIIGIGRPSGGRLNRMTVFSKKVFLAALTVDADVYHFHDPELLPWGSKLKKKGKKVIFDSHEWYVMQLRTKYYLPPWFSILVSKIYAAYERHVLPQLDAVILPGKIEGKNPFQGLCARTPIISNAAILDQFYRRYDPTIPRKKRQICYVGGLTEIRGITVSMKAAAMAEASLALAGDFSPPSYEETLRAMPEFSCVDYRGILSPEGVADLLSESQIGLCTILNEGQYDKADALSVKVFEYMSMGLPVILSATEYNQKIMKRYHFGLCVEPDNPEAVVSAIRYLLDNPEEARQMGENGRKAVREELNWDVEEKKLLALYEDILNEK